MISNIEKCKNIKFLMFKKTFAMDYYSLELNISQILDLLISRDSYHN